MPQIFDRTLAGLGRANQRVTDMAYNTLSGQSRHFQGCLISLHNDVSVLVDDKNSSTYRVENCLQFCFVFLQFFFHLLACGYVPGNTLESRWLSLPVARERNRCLEEPCGPVLSDEFPVGRLGRYPGFVYLFEYLEYLSSVFFIQIPSAVHAGQLVSGISQHSAQGIVKEDKRAGKVNLKVAVFNAFQYSTVLFLALHAVPPPPACTRGDISRNSVSRYFAFLYPSAYRPQQLIVSKQKSLSLKAQTQLSTTAASYKMPLLLVISARAASTPSAGL